MDIYAKITALQQKAEEYSDVWMVGEQLKDICRREPACVPILMEDLDNEDMGLADAAGKIKDYADTHHGSMKCFCVSPAQAEKILREFYGLPEMGAAPAPVTQAEPEPRGDSLVLNFDDFWG